MLADMLADPRALASANREDDQDEVYRKLARLDNALEDMTQRADVQLYEGRKPTVTELGAVKDSSKWLHPFPFDPTYGYDLDSLLAVEPPAEPPHDFIEFWEHLHGRALEVDVRPQVGPRLPQTDHGLDVRTVSFNSLGGVRLHGWLVVPAESTVERGLVIGHGYNGREQPDPVLPVPRAAAIFPVARGLGMPSVLPEIPVSPEEHVLHGIESRDTYVHGGCAADVWCAATALLELVPQTGERLDYIGNSFGGGIGALALPWGDRFHSAHLSLPSFGNHPLRATLPCVGSGAAVRDRYMKTPEVLEVLAYFDAATAAQHLRIPVQVAPALFDPAVPPPGQFAVFNALTGPKELHLLNAGHFYEYSSVADEYTELLEARTRFLV
ncbi:acetylxylan esterase [Streptomyces malaysiensis subsp. malaysiensis]|nr:MULTISPECIES: acetylxylan esterase [Streptomyces]UHH20754.1 acetylxylan esterase [Streptomyces sp. HNM0561]